MVQIRYIYTKLNIKRFHIQDKTECIVSWTARKTLSNELPNKQEMEVIKDQLRDLRELEGEGP